MRCSGPGPRKTAGLGNLAAAESSGQSEQADAVPRRGQILNSLPLRTARRSVSQTRFLWKRKTIDRVLLPEWSQAVSRKNRTGFYSTPELGEEKPEKWREGNKHLEKH